MKFLIYAQASCDETEVHLEFIHDSGYITDDIYMELKEENDKLGRKINKFIQYVETKWKQPITSNQQPATSNQQPATSNFEVF